VIIALMRRAVVGEIGTARPPRAEIVARHGKPSRADHAGNETARCAECIVTSDRTLLAATRLYDGYSVGGRTLVDRR
jgi:hypothetical protein